MNSPYAKAYAIIALGVIGGAGLVATVLTKNPGVAQTTTIQRPRVADPVKMTDPKEDIAGLRSLNSSYTSLAEYVLPAVVHIRTSSVRASDASGKRLPVQGSEGSGFIYREDGYVITNDHVVSGAKSVTVILNDGRELEGTVVSAPEWDIAVIKVKSDNLPVLAMSNSKDVKAGEMVMAIGSPYGLENSVTFGNVSALGRENVVNDQFGGDNARFYPDLIQTDAAINVGNSGGPLVNIDGQVIGMNSSIFTRDGGSNGIGFAIPSNQVKLIADILISKGKVTRSMIGVYPRDLKPYERKERGNVSGGALVDSVTPGSPADKAGMKKGDLIIRLDNEVVSSQIDLRNSMLTHAPGTTVKVTYLRDTKETTTDLKLEEFKVPTMPKTNSKKLDLDSDDLGDLFGNGKTPNFDELRKRLEQRKNSQTPDRDVEPLREGAKPRLGVAIDNLTDENRKQYWIPSTVKGVLITSVEPGSVADKAGYKTGDVIEQIENKSVSTVAELSQAMSTVKRGESRQFKVSRYGENSRSVMDKPVDFK
jgi:serine protease Do